MNKNLTMAIDEDLLKKARKIAIDKNTSVSNLIRNFIQRLVESEENDKKEIVAELESLFDHSKAKIGKKYWTRDDLYER